MLSDRCSTLKVMSWTRGLPGALAVCVLLLTGSVGCSSGGAEENGKNGDSPTPVGRLLDGTDDEGRRYREVDGEKTPEVGVEVQPADGGGWKVRLTLRHFRFTAAGTEQKAVAGRGLARLYVDGTFVTELRSSGYRLPARYVPHGTHQLTARLYADDGTVWAVDGEPVESTADITASDPASTTSDSTTNDSATAFDSATATATATVTESASAPLRAGGRGSPDRGGRAS